MKTKIAILLGILLSMAVQAFAIENKTFYSSGQINTGEQWNVVKIYGDSTVVDMLGGLVDVLHSFDASTTNMTGGEIQTFVTYDYSTANISSGSIDYFHAVGHSIVDFSGDASIDGISASDYGTLNLHEGCSSDHITITDNSMLNLYGGYISDSIDIWHNGMLNFYGGNVHVVNISGFGVTNLHGGGIENWLAAWDNSLINVFGYDLVKTSSGGSYGNGQVYGLWDDGTPFTIDLRLTETYSHINLIEVVDVEIKIHPETLNLSSAGRWLTCEIFIPEDYNAADVNSSSILLEDQIPAEWIWFNEEQNVVIAKFNRRDVGAIVEAGEIELTIRGELTDRTPFKGTDEIRVIDKGRKEK